MLSQRMSFPSLLSTRRIMCFHAHRTEPAQPAELGTASCALASKSGALQTILLSKKIDLSHTSVLTEHCTNCAGVYKGLCSLSVSGADKHVPLLPGGLDGRYKLHHCEGSRPAYVREKSPPARAPRILS